MYFTSQMETALLCVCITENHNIHYTYMNMALKNTYKVEIFVDFSNQAIHVLLIFTSNVKGSDTRNSRPIFCILVFLRFL